MEFPGVAIVDDEKFGIEVLNSSKPVLVIAGSKFSNDTKILMNNSLPVIMKRYENKIKVAYVPIEKGSKKEEAEIANPKIRDKYKTLFPPTAMVFAGGNFIGWELLDIPVEEQKRELEGLIKKAMVFSQRTI